MSLIWIFTFVSDENIFSLNETIQHSDHENPLLVGYLSETICLKYTAYSCSPGWWIFKPVFAGCFGSSLLDLWSCFLHISLLQCPLLSCWISVGSDAFLCSAFTWMQIHMSLTSAGISRTWRLKDEARNLTAVPSLSIYPPVNISTKVPKSASHAQTGIGWRDDVPADWKEKCLLLEIFLAVFSWLQVAPAWEPSRYVHPFVIKLTVTFT